MEGLKWGCTVGNGTIIEIPIRKSPFSEVRSYTCHVFGGFRGEGEDTIERFFLKKERQEC